MGLFKSKSQKAVEAAQDEMLRAHNKAVDAYWRSASDPSPEVRREMERAKTEKDEAHDAFKTARQSHSERRSRWGRR
ncbi:MULTISPECIES: hypothetical protein [Streptomyces]|uniref:Uncharacterized protein n=1 Tax=Streptomyces ehimensis TaxID=68195 RepID=A0ABV9BH21_9ACTN